MAQFQQETKSSIKNLENQVGQIAQALSKLEARDSGKLPSQTVNPRENISAVTLRSDRPLHVIQEDKEDDVEENEASTAKPRPQEDNRDRGTDTEPNDLIAEEIGDSVTTPRSWYENRDHGLLPDGAPRDDL